MLGQVEGGRPWGVWNGNESRLASEKEEEESMYITLNSDAASGERIKRYTPQKRKKKTEIFYTQTIHNTQQQHSAVPFIEVTKTKEKKH